MHSEKTYYHSSINSIVKDGCCNTSIYRIIPFAYLIKIIQSRTIWVSQTQAWDDTYENFLAKAELKFQTTKVSYESFLPTFYGQCWSLHSETDALWRIYSKDKTGVRIKSTIDKVLETSLDEVEHTPFSTRFRYIGKVEYLTQKQINSWINENCSFFPNVKTLLNSLYIKRKEFSHEKEIRLIINKVPSIEDARNGTQSIGLNLKIKPNNFIDEITFDPRLDIDIFQSLKETINQLGYSGKVNQSKLYEFRPNVINLDLP